MKEKRKSYQRQRGVNHLANKSPFDQMRARKGYSFEDFMSLAGVCRQTCRALKYMRPEELYTLPFGTIMRVCMLLRCKPTQLIPALGRKPGAILRHGSVKRKMRSKADVEVDVSDCVVNMQGDVIQEESWESEE